MSARIGLITGSGLNAVIKRKYSNRVVSEDTPKPPADCSNEMGEAIVIGAQKIHDNNTNTNNLDFISSHYPSQATLEPTRQV